MITLSLDPSLTKTGYAIFDDFFFGVGGKNNNPFLLTHGLIKKVKYDCKYSSTFSLATSVFHISSEISSLIYRFGVKEIVFECPAGSQNFSAATALSMVTGSIIGIIASKKIKTTGILAREAKTRVLENSLASKKDVMAWARETYPQAKFPKQVGVFEHIADAILVYHAARMENNGRELLL